MKPITPFITALALLFFSAFSSNAQVLDQQFPTVNGDVNTICIHGNTMYIGGDFTVVGGKSRKNIAAIDIPSKSVTAWNPTVDGYVSDIKAANGKVYICGKFTQVNSSSRNSLAAVDSMTGSVGSLNPSIQFPGIPGMQTGSISSIEITKNTLYFAGYFTSVNSNSRKNVAAIDVLTGNLLPFKTELNMPVEVIKVVRNTLYLGGPFSSVNGSSRVGFALLDRIDGTVLPWAPKSGSPGNSIYSIVPDGDSVYISGFFLNLNNSGHCFLAKTDDLGMASDWNPFSCTDQYPAARALYPTDSLLIVGGDFTNFNLEPHKNLIAMNKYTGAVSNWNPNPDNWVLAVTGNDSLIAVGGQFDYISGINQSNLAVYSKYGTQTSNLEPLFSATKITGYPNPAQSTFTLPLTQMDVKNLSVYTKDGKKVRAPYQILDHSLVMATEQLPQGEYIVQFETANGEKYLAMFTRLAR